MKNDSPPFQVPDFMPQILFPRSLDNVPRTSSFRHRINSGNLDSIYNLNSQYRANK